MKYTYATLLLNETGAEINEHNLTNVLEAAEADEITSSRIKALVAALEDVDIAEYANTATPATVEATAADTESDDRDAPGEEQAPGPSDDTDDTGLVFGDEATETSEADEPTDEAETNGDEDADAENTSKDGESSD